MIEQVTKQKRKGIDIGGLAISLTSRHRKKRSKQRRKREATYKKTNQTANKRARGV